MYIYIAAIRGPLFNVTRSIYIYHIYTYMIYIHIHISCHSILYNDLL